jgi:hypothetical protein
MDDDSFGMGRIGTDLKTRVHDIAPRETQPDQDYNGPHKLIGANCAIFECFLYRL